MSTVRDDLIAARALIDTPEKWIKGEYACAGRYCAVGAINAAARDGISLAVEALALNIPAEFYQNIPRFNDHPETKHPDVLAALDRAIASQSNEAV